MCSTTGKPPSQTGFTLIELMIALTVLIIGVAGILTLQVTQLHATSYTRHAGEAAVLGEHKLEDLRTETRNPACVPPPGSPCSEARNADGTIVTSGPGDYTVSWWSSGTGPTKWEVSVSWVERGKDTHTIKFQTQTP